MSGNTKKTVIELFAGVGGFRVGMNHIKKINENGYAIENGPFIFVWANQWEPSTKIQHAFSCYSSRFKDSIEVQSNIDISQVDKNSIPSASVLCGGFPCQDYSVARSLSNEKGIEGKKGVLWWQINEILKIKKPPFVLLENVDRLIKAPSKQRGRDFGIMLRCFNDKNYAVEWRVINAADYGHPQRRKRIYIFAYNKKTNFFKHQLKIKPIEILEKKGLFAKQFPVNPINDVKIMHYNLLENYTDLIDISNNFAAKFENGGYMINGKIYTCKLTPVFAEPIPLKKIIYSGEVDNKYYLSSKEIEKFKYLRGSKKINRKSKNGHEYVYSEGSMSPYDSLDLPGRTMLTSEGSVNRSTHIIKDSTDKLRILTPVECERLNQFPDNWTDTMVDSKRYFMMGNALVCGVIEKIGNELSLIIDKEK